MGRPVKIHKKKSFMFTSKHHSFAGCMGAVIGIFTIGVTIAMTFASYSVAGNVDINLGGVGLFSLILNVIGAISGYLGVNERDVFKTLPVFGVVSNLLMIIMWTGLIVISQFKG